MGVLRVERSAASGLAAKASGVAWRDYDIQLTVYAVLLAAIGLAMAYSHTTAQLGRGPRRRARRSRAGSCGRAWPSSSTRPATVFDYRWLRTLTWPIYVVNLALLVATLLLGDADAASSRWISVLGFQFQFSELAKILMIIVLARYLADRERRLDSLTSILGACLVVAPAVDPRPAPARPRDVARLLRDPRRHALHGRREPPLAGGPRRRRPGGPAARLDLRAP